jgi:hypothetical protein
MIDFGLVTLDFGMVFILRVQTKIRIHRYMT